MCSVSGPHSKVKELQQCWCLLPSQSKIETETRWPKEHVSRLLAKVSKINRMSACETHLVREEDLRDRVLIARVRIIDVRFGLLQLCLT
jgi:hypothetical protein